MKGEKDNVWKIKKFREFWKIQVLSIIVASIIISTMYNCCSSVSCDNSDIEEFGPRLQLCAWVTFLTLWSS